MGKAKYEETAASMIGLLRYGCDVPFNRMQRLEQNLGNPIPAATQWEVVNRAAGKLGPAYGELVRQAAECEVVHNDDTTMTDSLLKTHATRTELWKGEAEWHTF